ncbi:MAG TPA: aconitase family protein, partial [Candidatus Dormibacteraeota bacterium]|nr:aconitase family protein [Candidatus Dormibacteraeota bacterium]
MREDRSASGNARLSRASSQDAPEDRRSQASPRTLAQKLWDAHVVRTAPGEPDILFVDLHLVHEVTSPQAFEGLRMAGRHVRRPDLTVATMDHNVPTRGGVRSADELSRKQMEVLED